MDSDNKPVPAEHPDELATGRDIASREIEPLAILGLLGSILIPPIGFVLSLIAFRNIKIKARSGRNLAISGIIIGGMYTLLVIVYVVLAVLFSHTKLVTP